MLEVRKVRAHLDDLQDIFVLGKNDVDVEADTAEVTMGMVIPPTISLREMVRDGRRVA